MARARVYQLRGRLIVDIVRDIQGMQRSRTEYPSFPTPCHGRQYSLIGLSSSQPLTYTQHTRSYPTYTQAQAPLDLGKPLGGCGCLRKVCGPRTRRCLSRPVSRTTRTWSLCFSAFSLCPLMFLRAYERTDAIMTKRADTGIAFLPACSRRASVHCERAP